MTMYHFIRYMYGRWLADVRGRNRDSSTIVIYSTYKQGRLRYKVLFYSTCNIEQYL